MNNKYQIQRERAGTSTGISNSIMALLLVLGFSQMAICFESAAKLTAGRPIEVGSVAPVFAQTNSATLHGVTPAPTRKI